VKRDVRRPTEAEDRVVLLEEARFRHLFLLVNRDDLPNLGELGEEDEDVDEQGEDGEGEVDVLDRVEGIGVGAVEEGVGGDDRSDHGGDALAQEPGISDGADQSDMRGKVDCVPNPVLTLKL
jgi:hypothetical protein